MEVWLLRMSADFSPEWGTQVRAPVFPDRSCFCPWSLSDVACILKYFLHIMLFVLEPLWLQACPVCFLEKVCGGVVPLTCCVLFSPLLFFGIHEYPLPLPSITTSNRRPNTSDIILFLARHAFGALSGCGL